MKKETGITIIALVVTIVVLLILASITIGAITGDNGILGNANNAKTQTEMAEEKEIVDRATIQAMANNKRGNIVKDELQEQLDKITGNGKTETKIIRNKLIVEFIDSLRMYHVDDSGNVYEYEYKDLPIIESGLNFYNRIREYQTQILNIKVVDYDTIPDNVIKSFDVSKNQDKSVTAWIIQNEEQNDFYDLYIGGYDGVQASESCQNMFADLENVISIDLKNFYTDNTMNFGYMFQNCINLENLNISNLDTSKATYVGSLFMNCKSLKELDVSHFDTSNVSNMSSMFNNCSNLENINLGNFNTNKVLDMNYMFYNNSKLLTLDLSSFDTSLVTNTNRMFSGCSKLKTIYVSNKWNVSKVTNSELMFYGCNNLVGKIKYDSTKIDINYANYNTGYFTFKALEY